MEYPPEEERTTNRCATSSDWLFSFCPALLAPNLTEAATRLCQARQTTTDSPSRRMLGCIGWPTSYIMDA